MLRSYKRSSFLKSWELRYFRLSATSLSYFKKQPGPFSSKPRKVWPLTSVQIDYKGESRGSYYIFRVYVVSTKTTYTLGTLAATDAKEWVEALTTNSPAAPNTEPRPPPDTPNSTELEMEDLPKVLQVAGSILSNNFPWKLIGDALWSYKEWRKCEIAVPLALKEMSHYFTTSRDQWDWALTQWRMLSECTAFSLVLLESHQERTVVIQASVQVSPRRHIVVQESIDHVMYPSTLRISDYFLIEKSKGAAATLITRYLKTNKEASIVPTMLESFRAFPNFLQLASIKADLQDFEMTELRRESMQEVSAARKTVSFDESFVYGRGTQFLRDEEAGGLIFMDKVLIGKQKRVLAHMLKSMASNLAKGQSIINVSLPVNIFEPRSILERMMCSFGYSPIFLEQAAAATGIQRVKLVLTWAVTILHLSTDQGKPFNPVLGETFQASLGPAVCCCEQTSHHPPVSSFQIYGPTYHLRGSHEWYVSTGTNSVKGRSRGRTAVHFSDGEVDISLPWANISGTLFGKRGFNWMGVISVLDTANRLYGEVLLNPGKKGFFSKSQQPSDFFRGQISRLPENHPILKPHGFKEIWMSGKKCILDATMESLCNIEGYWPLYLDADSERLWSFDAFRPFLPVKTGEILPSDSRFREDILELARGDEDASQTQKERIETIQRRDRQLREHKARN